MTSSAENPVRISLLALPESSGSVLYGLYDVLTAVGSMWTGLTGEPAEHSGFDVQIVAPSATPFRCYGGVPVAPNAALAETPATDIILISDLAIDLDEAPRGRWPDAARWLADQHERGALICTVCTGTILLADTGLLDGQDATTHWAYADMLQRHYPAVQVRAERILVPAGNGDRLITTGGTASWEDLSLYLIARFCDQREAVRIAKLFLFGDRSEGQMPYAAMTRPRRHDDAAIADCQVWIADHYTAANPVARMAARSGLADRTFKRRFRTATGYNPVAYVQQMRIEEAKQLLETGDQPTDAVGAAVGYEDPAFFRRLFKRHTGVTPARYRQRVRAVGSIKATSAP